MSSIFTKEKQINQIAMLVERGKMKIIDKPRGTGKTWDMVLESYKTGYPILCFNKCHSEFIRLCANNQKIEIPDPIVYEWNIKIESPVLIDDLDKFLSQVIGTRVYAGSLTSDEFKDYEYQEGLITVPVTKFMNL